MTPGYSPGRRLRKKKPSMNETHVCRVGRIDFARAWAWQESLRQLRRAEQIPDTLMLVEHPANLYPAAGRRCPSIS